jgi:hypothetical protein
MKIEIFHLTQLSDWSNYRNHIVIMYNRQTIISEPISYLKFKDRYKLCKLLKLSFLDTIKFISNYYTRYPEYKHYALLWSSIDISDVIPFLKIICKDATRFKDREYDLIINSLVDRI